MSTIQKEIVSFIREMFSISSLKKEIARVKKFKQEAPLIFWFVFLYAALTIAAFIMMFGYYVVYAFSHFFGGS